LGFSIHFDVSQEQIASHRRFSVAETALVQAQLIAAAGCAASPLVGRVDTQSTSPVFSANQDASNLVNLQHL
jgi:hypothetical protein